MSGLPWDDRNVRPNLITLSRLQKGDKLSVLKKGAVPNDRELQNLGKGGRGLRELFDIQRGGWKHRLSQARERKRKGESLIEDKQYLIPLTKLFVKAYSLWYAHRERIEWTTIQAAFYGLKTMRQTYSSGEGNRKINEIIRNVQPLIPMRGESRGTIELRYVQDINLLTQSALGDAEKSIYEFLDASENKGLRQEAEDLYSNTQLKAEEIYGTDGPSISEPTKLPTNPKVPYTRKKLGMCITGVKDWKRRAPLFNGKRISFTNEGMKMVLEELDNDEAMLFLISQLVCQGGLEALMQLFMIYKTPANFKAGRVELAFHCQGKRIQPLKINHDYWISTNQYWVEVGADLSLNVSNVAAIQYCNLWEDPNDRSVSLQFSAGTKLAIMLLSTSFSLKLWRVGQEIKWDVVKARLKFRSR